MQLVVPSAVPAAVMMAASTWMMNFQMSFFVSNIALDSFFLTTNYANYTNFFSSLELLSNYAKGGSQFGKFVINSQHEINPFNPCNPWSLIKFV